MPPLVVIVGPPGSGKTTVGSALAAQLRVGLRDTDADIETTEGRFIPDIFVTDGEPIFREMERSAVIAALAQHEGVLALGGGAVESPDTRSDLRSQTVVALSVGATEAAKRVGISGPRPLLVGNVRSQWSQLMARRDPWYREVATITVATDGALTSDIVAEIVERLGELPGPTQ